MFSKPIKIVNAVSLDADNCLFNKYYKDLDNPSSVIQANLPLTKYLMNRFQTGRGILNELLSGSLRQDDGNDKLNSRTNLTNSFFIELERYKGHLEKKIKGLQLRKYLLADMNGPGRHGYSFDKSLGKINDGKPHPRVIDDYSKISLLYVQMHQLAFENTSAEISLDFIDDKISLLEKLEEFYDRYPELMPANLILNTHDYCGKKITLRKSIPGLGGIDEKYEEGFLDMVTAISGRKRSDIFALDYLDIPEKLNVERFKIQRGLDYSLDEDDFEEKSKPSNLKKENVTLRPLSYKELSSMSLERINLVNENDIYDIVAVGAGPSALYNIAQIKLYRPEMQILLLEKYPQYQREHILNIEDLSFEGSHPDESFQKLIKSLPRNVLTTEIEDKFLNFVKGLGVEIKYEKVDNCKMLAERYPSAKLFIGGDGARSTVHEQIFNGELEVQKTLKYIAQVKYHVEGSAKVIGFLKKSGVLSRSRHTIYEQIGKEKEGRSPVTLTILIDEPVFDKMKESRGGKFYQFKDIEKIDSLLMRSIDVWLSARRAILGEKRVTDAKGASERITVTDLSVSYSKEFYKELHGKKWCLIGDAAIRMPFFKSLNIGLVGGNQFAQWVNRFLQPESGRQATNKSFSISSILKALAPDHPLQEYNCYMKNLARDEATLAVRKSRVIGSLASSVELMQAVPIETSFLPLALNDELDEKYGPDSSLSSSSSRGSTSKCTVM